MPKLPLALLATGWLTLTFALPANAVGTRYPFCLQGNDVPGLSDCTYTSYAQCQATASGRLLSCIENPYYNPGGGYDPRADRAFGRARSVYPYPR